MCAECNLPTHKLARFGSPRPSAAWTSFNRKLSKTRLDVELYYTIMSTVYDGSSTTSVLPEAAAPIPAIGTDADAHTVDIDKLLDAFA